MKIAFFGTPELAVNALNEMESFGVVPELIVTTPDVPVGRKKLITPPPIKVWATDRAITVFQPTTLKNLDDLRTLTDETWDIFVVFAYGKILPTWLIELPKYGTINAHPSLLPKLRGASPIRSTILNDLSASGVTIIQMDSEVDHGPILYQQPVPLTSPVPGRELDKTLSLICGDLLTQVIKDIPTGKITPQEQNHNEATFCTKITKDMSELKIDPHSTLSGQEAYETYRKICAFDGWPETFFMYEGKRIKIRSAKLDSAGNLKILRVVPEGKSETDFSTYFTK